MHYKNGREAKNGDKVVLISKHGECRVGILHDARPGQDRCNGNLAQVSSDYTCDLADCLHIEDAITLFHPEAAKVAP
jgi:hypothetical protein